MIPETIEIGRGAYILPHSELRYALWRRWSVIQPMALCIGLNPSTANQTKDDPTIRRLCGNRGLLANNGFGGLLMMNLFPQITPYPSDLWNYSKQDEYLAENDHWLERAALQCWGVIFCWGNFETHGRAEKMFNLFPAAYCFAQNKNGAPKHPLYLPGETQIQPFKYPVP